MQKADAVFEGGGAKGIGLIGALQAFEEAGFQWQNLAGTSAGAITAALVAVGYPAAEIWRIMETRVEFPRFKDTWGVGKLPGVGPWINLIFNQGMYKGDYFLKLMRQLLSEKLQKDRVTFGDLIMPKELGDSDEAYERSYKYKLRVIASDISGSGMLVLPQDIKKLGMEPDELEVALAIRMSMSIPFFFKPVRFGEGHPPQADRREHWIMDGGILSNFPIWLFDAPPGQTPPWPTIGFLLWEPGASTPRYQKIGGLFTMIRAVADTLVGAIDRKALEEEEAGVTRIVKIPTGAVSTTDFDLTADARAELYSNGYHAAKEFLESWSFDRYVEHRASQTAGGKT